MRKFSIFNFSDSAPSFAAFRRAGKATTDRQFSKNTGFTLIEIITVMALMALIAGMAVIVNIDTYRGNAFRNERDMLVAVLQKARSQAMNNICLGNNPLCTDGKSHGVYLGQAGKYIIFQGTDYTDPALHDAAVDEVIKPDYAVSFAPGSFTQVVFSQLSGDATTVPAGIWSLVLTDSLGHISTTTINSEGRISW